MSTQHTALPWHVREDGEYLDIVGQTEALPDGSWPMATLIASAPWGQKDDPENKANMALIVRACNAHESLLEACEALLGAFSHIPDHWLSEECEGWPNELFDKARAAIAQARGEKGEDK